MRKNMIVSALAPLLGAALLSCAPMQKYDYEVISSTSVNGDTFEVVRRTPLGGGGQPVSGAAPELGIRDPANAFYPCSGSSCSDKELEGAADLHEARNEQREGGGGGGGGGTRKYKKQTG